jgi:Bacterial Ig domain
MRRKPSASVNLAVLTTLALASTAIAATGRSNGKPGGGKSCTRKTPAVSVDNNWAWGAPGSYGMRDQQLTYAIHVIDYDVGCRSSSFVVGVSAPTGFSVSLPASTISLKSSSSGYLWAYVTSPSLIADGDYPLVVTVRRSGSSDNASTTSWYKVYSSDLTAPTLYWASPGDGATITGRSFNVAVSASDDHAVKQIDLYLDNGPSAVSTKTCDDISFECQLNYTWSTSLGQHTATFKAYDWMGNPAVMTTTFWVG